MFKITIERYYPFCEEEGETHRASIETSNPHPTVRESLALFESLIRGMGFSFSGTFDVREYGEEKDSELEPKE